MSKPIKKYALVGCGGRGLAMFAESIVKTFPSVASLVGLCDVNKGRMDFLNRVLKTAVPAFTDFDRMIKETKPDTVIVTTKDSLHHEYILRSFQHG